MRKSALPALVILGSLVLIATPASAAMDGTWWVAGDIWFAEPSNLDLGVAFDLSAGLYSGGSLVGPDFGAEFSGKIRGGWRDRDATKNSYSIAFWSWDNDASMSRKGGVQPVISDPFFGNTYADRVRSDVNIKTSVLDLMMSRRLVATKRSAWYWGVGIRRATFEQDWETDYIGLWLAPGYGEQVDIRFDSTGTGFTVGIGSNFSWHTRWRSHVRAQVALLRGETDASYRDHYEDPNTPPLTSGIDRTDDRVFQQLELEARVSYTVIEGLEVSLGYWLMNWGNVVQVDRFFDDIQGGASFTRDDLFFDGFVIGASYTFR